MYSIVKRVVKRSPFFPVLRDARTSPGRVKRAVKGSLLFSMLKSALEERQWRTQGRPMPPPPAYKRKTIREFAKRQKIRTLVETGTFMGDTVEGLRRDFDRIYSIEVQESLYRKAVDRFSGVSNVTLLFGDSSKELTKVLRDLTAPAVFWLDAHYSAGVTGRGDEDSALRVELQHIIEQVNQKGFHHVLLLDDARDFWGVGGYPSLTEILNQTREELPPGYVFELKDDIVRIYNAKK